jgi:hypothetical protein
MKQQFVVNHRYTVLQETEKFDVSAVDQNLSMFCLYDKQFSCGHNILTDGVFVTQSQSDEMSELREIVVL